MLTPEQLTAIKEHMNRYWSLEYTHGLQLLTELDRLHDAIKAKDAVLAQFSDKENWIKHYADHAHSYEWVQAHSPIDLANQALNEGHE